MMTGAFVLAGLGIGWLSLSAHQVRASRIRVGILAATCHAWPGLLALLMAAILCCATVGPV